MRDRAKTQQQQKQSNNSVHVFRFHNQCLLDMFSPYSVCSTTSKLQVRTRKSICPVPAGEMLLWRLMLTGLHLGLLDSSVQRFTAPLKGRGGLAAPAQTPRGLGSGLKEGLFRQPLNREPMRAFYSSLSLVDSGRKFSMAQTWSIHFLQVKAIRRPSG